MRTALLTTVAQAQGSESMATILLVSVLGGGVALLAAFMVIKWLRDKPVTTSSPNREEQERAQREIAQARLQGVLTLQFVFAPGEWQAIAKRLPAAGNDMDSVLGLGRELRETRPHWLYVAARGTILMGEEEAAAESQRVLGIFQTRASTANYSGPGAMLLTIVVCAPSDYCEVMPADVEGFEMAVAMLFEMDSRGSHSYQLQWTEVARDTLPEVVPGIVTV